MKLYTVPIELGLAKAIHYELALEAVGEGTMVEHRLLGMLWIGSAQIEVEALAVERDGEGCLRTLERCYDERLECLFRLDDPGNGRFQTASIGGANT